MRKRYQTGGIKRQRGRWIGMWWVDGGRKSRVLGLVKDMSKSKAREAVNRIVAEENIKRRQIDAGISASSWMKFTFRTTVGSGRSPREKTT